MTKQVFIECSQGIIRDKDTGKKVNLGDKKQPPSRLQVFVDEHGGWDIWDFRVFPTRWDTRHEAELRKELHIARHPDWYTINIYKTSNKRAPPTKKPPEFDSDEESILTDT